VLAGARLKGGFPVRRCAGPLFYALALSVPVNVFADDIHERELDQQVQELRRQVDTQTRRIDQLESMMRSTGVTVPRWTGNAPATAQTPPWLIAANWQRVHPGMSADEVTGILGAPSSERPGEGGAKTLLYALEVQEGVFLAGRVELQDGKVSAVQKPELR